MGEKGPRLHPEGAQSDRTGKVKTIKYRTRSRLPAPVPNRQVQGQVDSSRGGFLFFRIWSLSV